MGSVLAVLSADMIFWLNVFVLYVRPTAEPWERITVLPALQYANICLLLEVFNYEYPHLLVTVTKLPKCTVHAVPPEGMKSPWLCPHFVMLQIFSKT